MRIHTLILGLIVSIGAGCGDSDTTTADVGVADMAVTDSAQGDTGSDASGGQHTPPTQSELVRLITQLASDAFDGRDEGTAGGMAARQYIIDELTACGVEPAAGGSSFEQPITTGSGVNILGKITGTGTTESARTIVLSAHYDHLGNCNGAICNGADDNAAGVAMIIGIACSIAQKPLKRTVLIAAWDAEEPPTFLTNAMGSAYFVANPTVPLAQIDAALVLDLVGSDLWPGYDGHFLLGSELSPEVGAAVQAAPVPSGLNANRVGLHAVENTITGQQPWSDYDAFRNMQVPVLFFSNGQNKRYHTPADELAGINNAKVTLEAEYLLSIVVQLGNTPTSTYDKPTFAANGTDYLADAISLAGALQAAVQPGGLADTVSTNSANLLQSDLTRIQAIVTKLQGGASSLTAQEISHIRSGAQRMMCLAGTAFDELICQLLP